MRKQQEKYPAVHIFGTLGGTRTPDPLLRRQLLYPPELQTHKMERVMGIEPTTSLEGWDSAIELHPHNITIISQKLRFVNIIFKKLIVFK